MGASNTTEKLSRDKSGRFASGNRANPAGRPRGSRHHALVALDKIGEQHAAEVLRRVVDDAIAGDGRAAEIVLSRVWPARKGRPVMLPLGQVRTAADVVTAMTTVVDVMSNGAISPDEAAAILAVIEAQRRAIETAELEARISRLESGQPPADDPVDSRPALPSAAQDRV
jgi:hypothetical protein